MGQDRGGKVWFPGGFEYEGPSCYELGTGAPTGSRVQPHYVGETQNEKTRIKAYAVHGSHIWDVIDDALRKGLSLFYRGRSFDTKDEAKTMQDRMLDKHDYDWNIILNTREGEF